MELTPFMAGREAAVFLMLAVALIAADMAGHPAQSAQIPAWYTASPQEMEGAAGTLIRQEPLTGALPAGASAWRILYRSTGLRGEPIAVSGLLAVPGGDAPADGRPIVAWAHPATGVVRGCAPSLDAAALATVMGLSRFLAQGYVVVATDYPGLGTPGQHPYLVGVSEARAVLDSVRAARSFRAAHAGRRFAVWGHSQGGHAALYTGMLAHEYAPELHLAGVAAAAPATDMRALTAGSSGDATLQAMMMRAWSRIYSAPLDRLVARSGQSKAMELAAGCIGSAWDSQQQPPEPLSPSVTYETQGSIGTTEPWASIAAYNSTGMLPAGVPVFLALGGADTLIPQDVNVRYMQRLCGGGVPVHLAVLPDVKHRFTGRDAAVLAAEWIAARFAGQPAPNDCR
jgi:acetyl esterase/lipase